MITASICGVLILPKFARPTPKSWSQAWDRRNDLYLALGSSPLLDLKKCRCQDPDKDRTWDAPSAINKAVTKKPKIVNQVSWDRQ